MDSGIKVTLSDEPEITTRTNTLKILENAQRDREYYGLDDYFIVDVDAHHVETDSWAEVVEHIPNPVIRDYGRQLIKYVPDATKSALTNGMPGLRFQDAGARIPHQASLAEDVPPSGTHRDVTLIRRAVEAMSLNYQVVFPQPMLEAGLHPVPNIAVQLNLAYNEWFVKTILDKDPAIKTMMGLPFQDPEASLETIRRYHDHPDVLGFLITSQRNIPVHHNRYMPVYAELERLGMPIGFHAGPTWGDTMTSTMNRFLSVHAMSFVTCNMTHMTNWIINGIPERFPGLKTIWIESGLAWLPFMAQRLDHEYILRTSDAPLLTKLPSEYMRDMFYTSQPLEMTDLTLLKSTFDVIDAPNTLLYSSDWPHWDFDLPAQILRLDFLTDKEKRNILGGNAQKVFGTKKIPDTSKGQKRPG
ncbi:amidohydrolase [Mycobacteroides immunogenum]|uniref:Amidohydrolase n=1 Tax=Mycobacteroides immunogenum TaxID=83262 RepID=A0A179VFH7_9MYCO|nr:amidohydrolase family protein [Mycobacteroides immunogenum]OAT69773.1 amidohydrolase [Mycobacteroides immunogenum]